MPKVFISYRREDAAAHAGRLYDHLSSHFGAEQIFMDIDTIQLGDDFSDAIEHAVGACDVLIALIGNQWLTSTGKESGSRLDDPEDFVRLEIATALRRNIRTIPVLVNRATIPRMQDLPHELRGLSRRNAIEVRDTTWRQDVTSIIKAIEKSASPQASINIAPKQSVWNKLLRDRRFALGFGVLIIAGISFTLWLQSAQRLNADDDKRSVPTASTGNANSNTPSKVNTNAQSSSSQSNEISPSILNAVDFNHQSAYHIIDCEKCHGDFVRNAKPPLKDLSIPSHKACIECHPVEFVKLRFKIPDPTSGLRPVGMCFICHKKDEIDKPQPGVKYGNRVPSTLKIP